MLRFSGAIYEKRRFQTVLVHRQRLFPKEPFIVTLLLLVFCVLISVPNAGRHPQKRHLFNCEEHVFPVISVEENRAKKRKQRKAKRLRTVVLKSQGQLAASFGNHRNSDISRISSHLVLRWHCVGD